jgi:hypothetical protein
MTIFNILQKRASIAVRKFALLTKDNPYLFTLENAE